MVNNVDNRTPDSITITNMVHAVGEHLMEELYGQDVDHESILMKIGSERDRIEAHEDPATWEARFCIGALIGSHTILTSYVQMIRDGEPRDLPPSTARNRASVIGWQIAKLRFAAADRIALHVNPSHHGRPGEGRVSYDTGESYAIDRVKGSLRAKFERAILDSTKNVETLWALGFAATHEPYLQAISRRIGEGSTECLLEEGLIEPVSLLGEGQEHQIAIITDKGAAEARRILQTNR